jgi:hypothetical protein
MNFSPDTAGFRDASDIYEGVDRLRAIFRMCVLTFLEFVESHLFKVSLGFLSAVSGRCSY